MNMAAERVASVGISDARLLHILRWPDGRDDYRPSLGRACRWTMRVDQASELGGDSPRGYDGYEHAVTEAKSAIVE